MPKAKAVLLNDPATARERIAAALDLKDLDIPERAFLATCQTIYRRHSGCTSPFEQFFRNLVSDVQHKTWPTPATVEHELETFKDDFETMNKWSRLFIEAYPATDGATPEQPAAEESTQSTTKLTAKAQSARKPRKKSHAKKAA